MLTTSKIKNRLKSYYQQIREVDEKLLRCERDFRDNPYQVFFYDFSDRLLNINSESDIEEYSRQILSEDYFKHPGSLQWNYYLIFLTEEKKIKSKPFVLTNEDYARKFIFNLKELKEWLESSYKVEIEQRLELPEDLGSIWIKKLKDKKLDCVFSSDISFPKGISGILKGKFERTNFISENEVESDPISFDFIKELHIEKFRECPKQDKFEFAKVNLIDGPNGSGKTSLLEAIELFTCGSNYRNKEINKSWSIKIKFRNQKRFSDIILKDNKLFRYRDKYWYNRTTYERKSRLDQSFKKFNFYNTDAAAELSIKKDDENEVLESLEQITLGADINYLHSQIIKYYDELRKINKSSKKDLDQLRQELEQETKTLKELQQQGDNTGVLFKRMIGISKRLNWRGYLPRNAESQTSIFELDIQKSISSLVHITKNLYWLDLITLDNLEKERQELYIIQRKYNKYRKDINEEGQKTIELEKLIKSSNKKMELLEEFLVYVDNDAHVELDGLQAKIEKLDLRYKNYSSAKSEFDKIDIEKIKNKYEPIFSALKAGKRKLNNLLTQKKRADQTIKKMKENVTELQEILISIKSQGKHFIKINKELTSCPLCGSEYDSVSELKRRIEKPLMELKGTLELKDLLLTQKELDNEIGNVKQEIQFIEHLGRAILLVGLKDDEKKKVLQIISELESCFNELPSMQDELRNMNQLKLKFDSKGLKENRLNELKSSLELGAKVKLDSSKVKKEIQNLKAYVKTYEKKLKLVNKTLSQLQQEIEKLASKSNTSYDRNTFEKGIKSRLKEVDISLKNIEKIQKVVAIEKKLNLNDLIASIQELNSLYISFKNELSSKKQSSIAISNSNKKMVHYERSIKKSSDEIRRVNMAIKVLDNLLDKHSKEDYFKNFFDNYKEEITDVFRLVHSPKEFKDWTFIKNKGMELSTEDNKKRNLKSISGGQRSALAISVFLTLNKLVKTGPKYILFDDPISFIDDLNVLSFLDYLREFIKVNDRQLFFATANENLAFLFRKKFDFLGDDFKRIPLSL